MNFYSFKILRKKFDKIIKLDLINNKKSNKKSACQEIIFDIGFHILTMERALFRLVFIGLHFFSKNICFFMLRLYIWKNKMILK